MLPFLFFPKYEQGHVLSNTSYKLNGIHMTGEMYGSWKRPHVLRLRRCCGDPMYRWSCTMWSSTTCPKEWWSSLVGNKISLYSTSWQPVSCMSKLDFAYIMTHHCMLRTCTQNVICVILAGCQGGKGSGAITGLSSMKSTCNSGKLERGWNRIMGLTVWPATTVRTWHRFTGPQESVCIHHCPAFQ